MQRPPEACIALLYLKTGGGHFSAALALQESLEERYGGRVKCHIFDPVPKEKFLANFVLQDGYRFSTHVVRSLWIFLYEFSKFKGIDYIWSFIVYRIIRRRFLRFIRENSIDTVVILHFLLIRPVVWSLRKRSPKPAIIRIVTDPFTAHPVWFSLPRIPGIVFSEGLRNRMTERYGFTDSSARIVPPILRNEFSSPPRSQQPDAIRRRLGLEEGKKCILFLGGGEGLPRAYQYIKMLMKHGPDVDVILVCGRDCRLKNRCMKLEGYSGRRSRGTAPRLRVFGYVDFVPELIAASDLVVTKAGPAVVMETLILRKPLIITHYHYGQEKGNLRFVLRRGAGFYASGSADFLELIGSFVEGSWKWNGVHQRVENIGIENGTERAADLIFRYARTGSLSD